MRTPAQTAAARVNLERARAARRTGSVVHESGARYDTTWQGLGRPTRKARLKAAATRHHNQKIATKAMFKGTSVTPRDAALHAARRVSGTAQPRQDYSRTVLPPGTSGSWVRLNWDKVRKASKNIKRVR